MENENKNYGHGGGCGKALSIIAIIISIISIVISAFTLGISIKNDNECPAPIVQQNCPMQNGGTCPMQDYMKNRFTPMWSMFDNDNRMNNRFNNKTTASSSNAKRKIGGYSPYNKAYDRKPVQDVDKDQSPQEYKTFDAPDNTYGEKLKERERQRRERRESIATRDTTDDN